jgi:hypothetical protein
MAELYHYTCEHGSAGIQADGLIVPQPQPPDGERKIVWLTDLEAPNRAALGLTSLVLQCDRMERRFVVPEPESVYRYVDVRRAWWPREWRELLESADGAMPMHWYVSEMPQRYDREAVIHGFQPQPGGTR